MEQLVLRDIPTADTEEAVFKSLRLPPDTDPEDLADARALVRDAAAVAKPKAVLCLSQITERGDGFVSVDGVRFDCALMAENFRALHRVFPYVCTCGCELEAWSQTLADPLHAYWADCVKLFYVGAAQTFLFSTVRERYLPTGHLSHMNPGSLSQWPLPQQRALFSILGDVEGAVGVTLTESFLMVPAKSTSGILFASETSYENCRLCPMPGCPNRRAPFTENNA